MRYFTHAEPHPIYGPNGEVVEETTEYIMISEKQIIQEQRASWDEERMGKPDSRSDEDCVLDHCAVHWASETNPNALNFATLRKKNIDRCNESFHKMESWSATDWATAMTGEVGECLEEIIELQMLILQFTKASTKFGDTIKKIRRLETNSRAHIQSVSEQEHQQELNHQLRKLIDRLALELADVVTYADLLAARMDIDLGEAVREKFNEVSDRVKSRITL